MAASFRFEVAPCVADCFVSHATKVESGFLESPNSAELRPGFWCRSLVNPLRTYAAPGRSIRTQGFVGRVCALKACGGSSLREG